MSPVDNFSVAVQRAHEGSPASLLISSGVDWAQTGDGPANVLQVSCVDRDVSEILTVGDSEDIVSRVTESSAGNLARLGARVVVCPISLWPMQPRKSFERAWRVDLLLRHEMHQVTVGHLDPETEAVVDPAGVASPKSEEAKALQLVESGDLLNAGFVLFEANRTPESRRSWIAGLIRAAHELCPSSADVELAAEIAAMSRTDFQSQEARVRHAVESVRSAILDVDMSGTVIERALYMCELSLRSLSNMEWFANHDLPTFDRDTGWWIVRSALLGTTGDERERWMRALFPRTGGVR